MIEDEQFLKQAIELARQARTDGNHPFGALLVLDGRVVLTARNTVITQQNPTAHAEHNLVGDAIRHLLPDQIARCVLYTSCEPCAMYWWLRPFAPMLRPVVRWMRRALKKRAA